MKMRFAPLMFAIGLVTSPTVQASDPVVQNLQGVWYGLDRSVGWHYDLGVGFSLEPTYAGSASTESEADLLAQAFYRSEAGHRYFIGPGELKASFFINPETQFSMFLEFEEGREPGDDPVLNGMDPIDSTVEGQFVLARRFGNTSIFATLQPDLLGRANKGFVWFVGAGHDMLVANNRLRVSTRVDLSGGNAEYMRTEFGVTSQEATRTGYNEYQPGGGLKSATLGFSAEYYLSKRLSVLGIVEAEHYLDNAADSPLIAGRGRTTTFESSVFLRWRF